MASVRAVSAGKPSCAGGFLHGFEEQEYVGRAAARNGGHAIDQGFAINPDGLAHGTENGFGRFLSSLLTEGSA